MTERDREPGRDRGGATRRWLLGASLAGGAALVAGLIDRRRERRDRRAQAAQPARPRWIGHG
jgi:hypothetical protein